MFRRLAPIPEGIDTTDRSDRLAREITSYDGESGLASVVSCGRFFVAHVQFSLHPRKNPCGNSRFGNR